MLFLQTNEHGNTLNLHWYIENLGTFRHGYSNAYQLYIEPYHASNLLQSESISYDLMMI